MNGILQYHPSKGGTVRHSVVLYVFLFVFFASLIGGSVFSTYKFFMQEGPLAVRKEIFIPKGIPLRKIADLLKKEGIIESPAVFTFGVRAHNKSGELKTGEYSIPARSSAKMVMDILTGGQTYIRRVTIPEGQTSKQIIDILNKTDGLIGTITSVPKNGTLLPETYYYSYGDSRQSILGRMRSAMERTIQELWESRIDDLPFETPGEAIVLASIVEKETSISAERNHIASVFINRIETGMRLQSDPTVIYAVTEGLLNMKRSLTTKDLRMRHPFNTYVINGLPPAPIANPGRDSIQAVLNPFKSQDIYFVADGSGGHVFAKTYDKHIENVKKWRIIRGDKKAQKEARKQKKIQNISEPPPPPVFIEKTQKTEDSLSIQLMKEKRS